MQATAWKKIQNIFLTKEYLKSYSIHSYDSEIKTTQQIINKIQMIFHNISMTSQ